MSSIANVIAISRERPVYPQSLSRWFAKTAGRPLRLVMSFYSPDGNEVAMPLASISAYLKRDFPWVELHLCPILILRDEKEFQPENFAKSVAALQPDLIAFSVMSPHWFPMEPYFAEIKKLLPDAAICIGGYQAMLSQQQTIANRNVDFICTGDGEYAMGNLVQFMRGSKDGPVDGMWERMSDDSVVETDPHQIGDLAALPFPDYDIFEKADGFNNVNTSIFGPKEKLVLPVMTGRGCPYRCTYCCNTPLLDGWKNKKEFLRKYEPQAMVDELIRLRDKYGVGYFEFWDELFLSNLKFVNAFFELYKDQVGLPFSINSRVEVMNEKFCEKAAAAGCHTIWFGIESGDETYRTKMLGRKMTNEQVIAAAENCKKAGINRLTFNIVGMPLETAENMRQTLELNRIIAPEFFFFFNYIPLRGTPLYEVADREGLLMHDKKDLHYLSGALNRRFFLNLKENPDLLSQDEFESICFEMLEFQEKNNRLSFADGEDAPRIIKADTQAVTPNVNPVSRIEQFAGQEPLAVIAQRTAEHADDEVTALDQLASKRQRSLMGSLRGLFRSP